MAKIIGFCGIAAVLITLACFASRSIAAGFLVLGAAISLTVLFVHLVGMIVYNEWWPWRHL